MIYPEDFKPTPLDVDKIKASIEHRSFDAGAQGSLYRIVGNDRLVFKKYKQPQSSAKLAYLNAWITKLRALDRDRLGQMKFINTFNLPVQGVVDREGMRTGVILPLLPEGAMRHAMVYNRKSRKYELDESTNKLEFRASYLIQDETIAGFITDEKRFVFALSFAYALKRLHEFGLVHGDLSHKNVLMCRDSNGLETAYIIDIDDLFPATPGGVKAFRKTASKHDPHSTEQRTIGTFTDVYVYGLWLISFIQKHHPTPQIGLQNYETALAETRERVGIDYENILRSAMGPINQRPDMNAMLELTRKLCFHAISKQR